MKINVCLLQPSGYIHSLALLEVAEFIKAKAIKAGHDASLAKNRISKSAINIVLGAHSNPDKLTELPPNTIIFNTEQTTESTSWTSASYQKLLNNYFVWDYSQHNLDLISHSNKALINFYYSKELKRIHNQKNKVIDLLFYGSINERRKRILETLMSKGLNIKPLFGLYGKERDEYLSQTRAVLNLHYYDSQIFQQIRAFYPLTNGIPVISENFPLSSAPLIYEQAIFTPKDKEFCDYTYKLLSDKSKFDHEKDEKIELFLATEANEEFNSALNSTLSILSGSSDRLTGSIIYSKMNLGSGKDYLPNHLNVDVREEAFPDVILDLSQKVAFPLSLTTRDNEKIDIRENQFEEIIANDVLEHVPDLETLMTNCLKILKVGGKFSINVPYDLSLGAWQDPTHIRGFNQNSWLYYTDWFWYLAWFDYRFESTDLQFILSDLGNSLVANKIEQEKILATPRAIDSMKVTLIKRETTPEEKTIARSYSNNLDY